MLPCGLPGHKPSRPATFSSLEHTFARSSPTSYTSNARAPSNLRSRKHTPPSYPIAGHKPVSSEGEADHATIGLPTPRPSLDTPNDSRSPPSRASSDPTDPNVVALPTPRPSLDSSSEVHPLSFDQVLTRLKPLLDGTAGERKISIEGVSSKVVDELLEKSRASELPGWENLRYLGLL